MSDEAPKRGRGRPKGSTSRRTIAEMQELFGDGSPKPLEFLKSVYQNPEEELKTRVDAAKAAAPYCHAKLQSIELSGTLTEVSQEEWLKHLS